MGCSGSGLFWRSLVESANAVAVVESTQISLEVGGAVESERGSFAPPKENTNSTK